MTTKTAPKSPVPSLAEQLTAAELQVADLRKRRATRNKERRDAENSAARVALRESISPIRATLQERIATLQSELELQERANPIDLQALAAAWDSCWIATLELHGVNAGTAALLDTYQPLPGRTGMGEQTEDGNDAHHRPNRPDAPRFSDYLSSLLAQRQNDAVQRGALAAQDPIAQAISAQSALYGD
jgi:hypothetical protein